MEKNLLFLVCCLFLLSFNPKSLGQNPPPPGYSPTYACDENGDGLEQFDLVAIYPFQFNFQDPSNYHPTKYYETEDDAYNDVNSIPNPSSYINTNNPQFVYFRADPLDPNTHNVLFNNESLYVVPVPTANTPEPFIVCDLNNNGFEIFNLNIKRQEILSGQNTGYSVAFFETYDDAVNLNFSNDVYGEYTNTIAYQQTIYASVFVYGDADCVSVVELDLIVQSNCEDLAVFLTNNSAPPRPGFDFTNYLYIENLGSQDIASGTVEFTLDTDVQLITVTSSSSNYVITTTSTGFTYDFTNLEIGESDSIQISLHCPAITDLGTQVINTASYTTSSNDVHSYNNTSTLTQTVVGSYDPNDIMESHGPKINIDNFTSEDYLYYTIRFQNVGTADAINIRIEDILDYQLDETTFQMINSSHGNILNRTANLLTWNFNSIYLPSSNVDEEGSQGFVYYKIKPKAGYAIGDIIPNTAAIYFDFNAPVITNTFETEFEPTLSTIGFNQISFNIYPNPAEKWVDLNFRNTINETVNVNVYNMLGKLVIDDVATVLNNKIQLNISALESGLYFVKAKINKQETTRKLIIK